MKNIKRVHLVYPVGKKISTPDSIGRQLKKSLEQHYDVQTYDLDEFRIIKPGDADVLLGHWHPNPFTVFRMSAKKKGWKRVLALAPFCPDPTGWHNAFGDKIIEKCDRFLAITGNAWIKRLKESPFSHWEPKIVHLDLAIDRVDFPFIKRHFNPVEKRRFLYIGHTAWYKNITFLERLAKNFHEIDFAWMGGTKSLKNINTLGIFDFSKQEAKNLIKKYDFLITVGSSDGNPTTILEAMAWGLIPVCSVQSGYEGFSGIRNISIDEMEDAVATINKLQSVSEEKLKKWQQDNLDCLDNHFNWERFCSQVLDEIESKYSPHLAEITSNNRLSLQASELESPYYWGRPINFYHFLKANLKYAFQNITANLQRKWRLIDWHKHY
jgi:glycosyltransferase involved in cell wall biosynthesis